MNHKYVKSVEAVEDSFALSEGLFRLNGEEKAKYDIDLLGRLRLN